MPGDAAATAHNIAQHSTLFRLGFVADLAMATSFIFLGMAFYKLFKYVNKDVAAALVLLLDIHRYGYVTAGILFGLWILPLGYLAYTSGMFPRVLGVVLMIACFGYLIDTLTVFLVPDLGATFSEIVKAISGVAEFWMVGYLLFIGVRTPRTAPSAPITA